MVPKGSKSFTLHEAGKSVVQMQHDKAKYYIKFIHGGGKLGSEVSPSIGWRAHGSAEVVWGVVKERCAVAGQRHSVK